MSTRPSAPALLGRTLDVVAAGALLGEQQRAGPRAGGQRKGVVDGAVGDGHGGCARQRRQRLALGLERRDQLVRVRVAVGRVLGERPQDDGVQGGGQARPDGARRVGLGGHLLEGDRHRRFALERDHAGEQLVEDHPDRVQVGGGAHRVALGLLGREVLGGAHDRARERHVRGARPGDAEVRHARPPLFVEDHVVGLEVAVDDAAPVGEARRAQDLHDDLDRARRVERALFAHDRLQRAAGHVLHGDVVGAVPLAAVEDGHDVRVRQGGRARGLAPEALDELLVFGEVVVEHLHRHLRGPAADPRQGTRPPCRPSRAARSRGSGRR